MYACVLDLCIYPKRGIISFLEKNAKCNVFLLNIVNKFVFFSVLARQKFRCDFVNRMSL